MPPAGPPTLPLEGVAAAVADARTAAATVTDRLFGTRSVTAGAARQLPRKTPLRIEPKTYFGKRREGSEKERRNAPSCEHLATRARVQGRKHLHATCGRI